MLVFVLNKHGEPLMPCKPRKAKILLKEGKAKVVKRVPFTIQLKFGSSGYKQNVTLGVDSGFNNIGLSAVTEKQEVYAGEFQLRTDIVDLNSERRQYRRSRRNRKTWYRKPRFLNRGNNSKGWLAPSLQHKLKSHIKIINQIKNVLPVTKINVEVAAFDIQKIKNPEIKAEKYQQGEQLRFWTLENMFYIETIFFNLYT
jgi:N6-L-threonylcarbamoyladenine synthase